VPTLGLLQVGTDSAFLACSGATTASYYAPFNGEPAQQINLGVFQSLHNIKAIVLTLGGNDMGFESIVNSCLSGDCSKDKDKAALRSAIEGAFRALQNGSGPNTYAISRVLSDIHSQAPDATIFLIAYPRLFGANVKYFPRPSKQGRKYGENRCPLGFGLAVSYANAQYMNALADRLNGVLAGEAAKARAGGVPVTFVSVRAAFTTHGLCDSGAAWINYGRLSLTPAPIGWVFTSHESLHPNKSGHAAYEAVIRKTVGL
jgi:hypothetical protein